MKRWLSVAIILMTGFIFFCNDFIKRENETSINNLEKGTYVMKDKVTVNDETLSKGQRIKVKITWGKNWVRVRGFSADVDPLQAKQVLLIYLFEEKFPDKKFNMDYFSDEFNGLVQPVQNKQ